MSLGGLLGMAVAHYLLPEDGGAMNHMIGMMIGTSAENLIHYGSKKTWDTVGRFSFFKTYRIVISKKKDSAIFMKLQKYITAKHIEMIKQCVLIEENGDVTLSLQNSSKFTKPITEMFDDHIIKVHIYEEHLKKDDNGNSIDTTNTIVVESKTANVLILQKFVEHISQIKMDVRLLRVYRGIIEKGGKDKADYAYWEELNTVTNKRIENTIVSQEVEKNLFQDVKKFLDNPEWYHQRGIPWKRGYLLHGPPGTGKTSVIKAIANEYSMDVFSIQMDSLCDDQFINLMTSISARTNKKPYILTLEDIDRSKIFNKYRNHYDEGKTYISFSTLLNEIDGIVESYGRILIITANDYNKITSREESAALFRPGRIDKKVELTYCDQYQMKGIISQFIGKKTDDKDNDNIIEHLKIPQNIHEKKITPAAVIAAIQESGENVDELKNKLLFNPSLFLDNIDKYNKEQTNCGILKSSSRKKVRQKKGIRHNIQNIQNNIKRTEKKYAELNKQKEKLEKEKQKLEKMKEIEKRKREIEKKRKRIEKVKEKEAKKRPRKKE